MSKFVGFFLVGIFALGVGALAQGSEHGDTIGLSVVDPIDPVEPTPPKRAKRAEKACTSRDGSIVAVFDLKTTFIPGVVTEKGTAKVTKNGLDAGEFSCRIYFGVTRTLSCTDASGEKTIEAHGDSLTTAYIKLEKDAIPTQVACFGL